MTKPQYHPTHKRIGRRKISDQGERADTRTLNRILICLSKHKPVNQSFIRENIASDKNLYKIKDGLAFLIKIKLIKKEFDNHGSNLYSLTEQGRLLMNEKE